MSIAIHNLYKYNANVTERIKGEGFAVYYSAPGISRAYVNFVMLNV